MYYPQDTVLEMGPTAVAPGSQYLSIDHEEGRDGEIYKESEIGEDHLSLYGRASDSINEQSLKKLDPHLQQEFVKVPAGSFVLLHYDIVHRGTRVRGKGQPTRYMFKFQFYRTIDPAAESLPLLPAPVLTSDDRHTIHDEMHRFLGGISVSPGPSKPASELLVDLRGSCETVRVVAGYSLGRLVREGGSREALEGLASALQTGPESCRRASAFGLIAAGPQAVVPLLELLAVAEERAEVPMRKYVFFVLGEVGDASEPVVEALGAALKQRPPFRPPEMTKQSLGRARRTFTYEVTLEMSTACVALGLLGRGALSSPDVFDSICCILGEAALQRGEKEVRPGSGKYRIREDAAYGLTLLCALAPQEILERGASDAGPVLHEWLIHLLALLAKDEDRYVMGYAAQALRCLAEAGSDMASQSLYEALLDSALPEDTGTLCNAQRDLEVLNCREDSEASDSCDPRAEEGRLMRLAALVDRHGCTHTARRSPY